MQDIHAIGGATTIAAGGKVGGGSLFLSGSSGGDRRLRQNSSQNNQLLKCPRCDSPNTKFCYYNNYNLSQPRHYCKGCRRYWTKGGVLRNVPVGGGCRKANKRSKQKQSASSPVANNTELDSNSNSSSESSSLTAAKTSTEVASATVNSSNSPNNLLSFPQPPSRFFLDQHQPSFSQLVSIRGQIFPETGSLMNLITTPGEPSPSPLLGFNIGDVSAYRIQENVEDHNLSRMMLTPSDEEFKMEQINFGYLDPTANIDFTSLQQSRVGIGGLAGLDWQINGQEEGGTGADQNQGLYEFAGNDDHAYLSHHNWLDNDASLNFPPLI